MSDIKQLVEVHVEEHTGIGTIRWSHIHTPSGMDVTDAIVEVFPEALQVHHYQMENGKFLGLWEINVCPLLPEVAAQIAQALRKQEAHNAQQRAQLVSLAEGEV